MRNPQDIKTFEYFMYRAPILLYDPAVSLYCFILTPWAEDPTLNRVNKNATKLKN